MRGLWWTLKLLAGLAIVGCLLAVTLVVVSPGLVRNAEDWAAILLIAAAVYWFANARLGVPASRPSPSHWKGELYVLPVPWLRQVVLCVVLAGLSIGIPLALVCKGPLPGWEGVSVLLGALLGLWLCRASVLGLLNLRRAGHALKLDAAGIHFPGLPALSWTQVTDLALEPRRPDSDRSQCLVLQMRVLPEHPSGLRALWRAALPGASIRRNSISLPLPALRDSASLLDAAQTLWRRHGSSQRQ
ncbi:hypothetical protein ACS5PN_07290 [Roseateles sp. NT4]|uniref:hypothetical protein n=1 Tax=Roseateles sp. NT4 TaxID=3453715 RepID=UPI003EE829C0